MISIIKVQVAAGVVIINYDIENKYGKSNVMQQMHKATLVRFMQENNINGDKNPFDYLAENLDDVVLSYLTKIIS